MSARKITIWCTYDGPESDLATILEQGELFETAWSVQYMIEEVTGDG